MAKHKVLKMVQILAAPFGGTAGMTYSTLGLDADGQVWRYDLKRRGWVAYVMTPVDPAVCDGHRR